MLAKRSLSGPFKLSIARTFALTLVPTLARVHVLLLSGAAVLEPDLRHPLAQPRDLRDPLQVLSVRVRVNLEVGLQDLDLLLREGGAHALRLLLRLRLRRFAAL